MICSSARVTRRLLRLLSTFQAQALSCKCIDDGKDAYAASRAGRVSYEIKRPLLIASHMQGLASDYPAKSLPSQSSYCQPFVTIKPIQPHDAHSVPAADEHGMQTPIAITRLLTRQRDHFSTQCRVAVRPRFIAVRASIHGKELAGPAFTHGKLFLHERHVLP
jgi:hypothetical protein